MHFWSDIVFGNFYFLQSRQRWKICGGNAREFTEYIMRVEENYEEKWTSKATVQAMEFGLEIGTTLLQMLENTL